jgi:hypothetical protein
MAIAVFAALHDGYCCVCVLNLTEKETRWIDSGGKYVIKGAPWRPCGSIAVVGDYLALGNI